MAMVDNETNKRLSKSIASRINSAKFRSTVLAAIVFFIGSAPCHAIEPQTHVSTSACIVSHFEGFIEKPKHVSGQYDHVVHGTAIVKQCGETCWLESGVATLESASKKAIASEYNVIETMRENAYKALENINKADVSRGVLAIGKTPNDGLKTIERQGIVYRNQFAFTPEFLKRTEKVRNALLDLGVNGIESVPPLELTNVELGRILRQAKEDANGKKLRPDQFKEVKQQIDSLLDAASAGLKNKNVDPFGNFNHLFPNGRIEVYKSSNAPMDFELNSVETAVLKVLDKGRDLFNKSRFRFHTAPWSNSETENAIVSHLNKGKSVWLAFYRKKELIDETNGIARLPTSVEEQRKLIRAHPNEYIPFAHGVVVEGYKLDSHDKLEWLLIRDSQGSQTYDHGYIHMSGDYFRAMMVEVSLIP